MVKHHCPSCTPKESACITEWEVDEHGAPALLYAIPRGHVPPYESSVLRHRENWPRMLQPTRPMSTLGVDDLQDWAFEEEDGEFW